MPEETKNPKIFYGWFIVAACFMATLTLGETICSFGIFFKPLGNEFGWSRSIVSSAYTAFLIGHSISQATSGRLADRFSPRPLLFGAAVLAGFGIFMCSQINDIDQLRLFLFISGLGSGATWSVPSATVQRWFYRRQRAGLALSIVVAGVGVGAVIFAPLVNYLILNYGWRDTFLVIGILFFIAITLSAVVIRRSPVEPTINSEGELSSPKLVITQDCSTGKLMTNPAYIAVTFVTCVTILTFHVISVHLIPMATDIGISATVSAVALGLLGGFSVPGRFVAGFVADRIGWQKVLVISIAGIFLSLLWLLLLKAAWMLYCFVFCFGLFHGARVSSVTGILGEYFGMRSLGALIGLTFACAGLTSAFAPYMAGFIFDVTGSYFIAFIILAVLLLCAAIVATVIKKPAFTLR
ncbi:MFS transporter [Chloroflexota bacterium]